MCGHWFYDKIVLQQMTESQMDGEEMLKFMKNKIEKDRKFWLQWEKDRDAKFTMPENVEFHEDVRLGETDWEIVDIYMPKEQTAPLPVLIDIHGGGLVMGTKHQNLGFCADMAKRDFLTFAIEYPLVPEATVIEQLNAVSKAVDAIGRALESYNGDSEKVYLVGDSAGAFLAMYVAVLQRNPTIVKEIPVTPTKTKIRALGLSSCMFYSTKMDEHGIFLLANSFYGKGWRRKSFAPYINPEHPEVVNSLPPCFLSTAAGDFLREYTIQYEKAMTAAGIVHELVDLPDKLEHAYNALYPDLPGSHLVNTMMAEFLLLH